MRSFVLIFIFFFCLTACQNTGFVFDSEPGSDDDVPDTNESPTPLNPIDPTTSSVSLLSLNLEQEGEVFILEVGQTQDLSFQVQFSDVTI